MSNKITTRSYTTKRLRDMGYAVDRMDNVVFSEKDKRKWVILIDRGGMAIVLTCYKDDTIHAYDGGRYLNTKMRHSTDSIEVLAEFFHNRGLIHKHYSYASRRE